jgi:hypothetical protein
LTEKTASDGVFDPHTWDDKLIMGCNEIKCLDALLNAFKKLPLKSLLRLLDVSRAFKGYTSQLTAPDRERILSESDPGDGVGSDGSLLECTRVYDASGVLGEVPDPVREFWIPGRLNKMCQVVSRI